MGNNKTKMKRLFVVERKKVVEKKNNTLIWLKRQLVSHSCVKGSPYPRVAQPRPYYHQLDMKKKSPNWHF